MKKNWLKPILFVLAICSLMGIQSFVPKTHSLSAAGPKVSKSKKIAWAVVGSYTCPCLPGRTIWVWVYAPNGVKTSQVDYVSLTWTQPTTFYAATGTYNGNSSVSNVVCSSPTKTCSCTYSGGLTPP